MKTMLERFRRWFDERADAAEYAPKGVAPASALTRFVYFCPNEKCLNMNGLSGLHVNFCVHGEKDGSRKIKGLA
jgi:hypothetical protein